MFNRITLPDTCSYHDLVNQLQSNRVKTLWVSRGRGEEGQGRASGADWQRGEGWACVCSHSGDRELMGRQGQVRKARPGTCWKGTPSSVQARTKVSSVFCQAGHH